MGFRIKIENVVASASLNVEIKLEKVVANMEGIEYEPEQFPGLVLRWKEPKAAALIFSSGKVVCTGAKSPGDAKLVISKIVARLNRLNMRIPLNYKVQLENIVASARLNRELNLDNIAFSLENTEYEPEQFPGLVYRMDDPKVTFLLFGSGKIICTGGRSINDVRRAVAKIDKKLRTLKKLSLKSPSKKIPAFCLAPINFAQSKSMLK